MQKEQLPNVFITLKIFYKYIFFKICQKEGFKIFICQNKDE